MKFKNIQRGFFRLCTIVSFLWFLYVSSLFSYNKTVGRKLELWIFNEPVVDIGGYVAGLVFGFFSIWVLLYFFGNSYLRCVYILDCKGF